MLTKKEIIEYCNTYSGVYEDYPFDGEWTAMRLQLNKKCFALIYERNAKPCLNLKCEPMQADFLRRVYPSIIPAYHMNKTHWNTVIIDGSIPNEEIFEMISHSYDLIKPKIKQKKGTV